MCKRENKASLPRHLRHPVGIDEATGFDIAEAGVGQQFYQSQLSLMENGSGFVLQTVRGPTSTILTRFGSDERMPLFIRLELQQLGAAIHPGPPADNKSELLRRSAGCVQGVLHFSMASITSSASPLRTALPLSTNRVTTVPFIGADRRF